jgi:hypothetical protein
MLIDDQIVAVKRHLGLNSASEALYPFVTVFFSVKRILTTLPASTEAAVVEILAKLDATEAAMTSALSRLRASTVGRIRLNHEELRDLREERLAWRRELAALLGVPLMAEGSRGQIMVQ